MTPSRNDYLAKAHQNRDFAYSIRKNDPIRTGWALTILFYSALHYVQAYLAAFNFRVDGHKALHQEIARNPVLEDIFDDYMDLFDYSYNCRYRMNAYCSGDFDKAKEAFLRIESHISGLFR